MNLFGFEVHVVFLVYKGKVMAYGWHFSEDKALRHLKRIAEFHGLDGEVTVSGELEKWLLNRINSVVLEGERFELPDFPYRYKIAYEKIADIPRGSTRTYSEIARESGINYTKLLSILMRNPFQILIPCQRLLTKKRTLMGFYPLGKKVKKRLLQIEGAEFVD